MNHPLVELQLLVPPCLLQQVDKETPSLLQQVDMEMPSLLQQVDKQMPLLLLLVGMEQKHPLVLKDYKEC